MKRLFRLIFIILVSCLSLCFAINAWCGNNVSRVLSTNSSESYQESDFDRVMQGGDRSQMTRDFFIACMWMAGIATGRPKISEDTLLYLRRIFDAAISIIGEEDELRCFNLIELYMAILANSISDGYGELAFPEIKRVFYLVLRMRENYPSLLERRFYSGRGWVQMHKENMERFFELYEKAISSLDDAGKEDELRRVKELYKVFCEEDSVDFAYALDSFLEGQGPGAADAEPVRTGAAAAGAADEEDGEIEDEEDPAAPGGFTAIIRGLLF